MSDFNLRESALGLLGTIREILKAKGTIRPFGTIIIRNPDDQDKFGVVPVDLAYADNDQKRVVQLLFTSLAKKLKPFAVFVAMEAWYVLSQVDEMMPESLVDHPERVESLVVIGRTEDSGIYVVQPFYKEHGKVAFGKIEELADGLQFDAFTDNIFNTDRPLH